MALYIAGVKLYELYDGFDTKLDELEFTELEQWAVKWLIKNTLLTTFLLCQFCQVERLVTMDSLLKMSSLGIALVAAWVPCLKAYPLLSVLLYCIEAFFLAVGPLYLIPMLIRNLWYAHRRFYAGKRLGLHKSTFVLFTAPSWKQIGWKHPETYTFYKCDISIVILFEIFWDDLMADFPEFFRNALFF